MALILEMGRPESLQGRLPKEIRCYELLDRLGVEYRRVDHPAAMTMEDCREIDRVLLSPTCKNLLLCNRQKTAFYLLLMPGDKPFKTKDLSAQIGSSRLSFAEGEDMERLLDITPGSLSVLGLANDAKGEVQLLIDQDVLEETFFGCHPCINTSTLGFTVKALLETVLPALGRSFTTVSL